MLFELIEERRLRRAELLRQAEVEKDLAANAELYDSSIRELNEVISELDKEAAMFCNLSTAHSDLWLG